MREKWMQPAITIIGIALTLATVWGALGVRVKTLETQSTAFQAFKDLSADRLARIETKVDQLLEMRRGGKGK